MNMRSFCLQAATNDKFFKKFKQDPTYRVILEHVNESTGREYFNFIKDNYPHLVQEFGKFQSNDLLGTPSVYHYPEIGRTGPTTLRYVKVLGDLEAFFGSLDNKKIVEIGCGYGGQCLIIAKAYNFEKFFIVDLPEPMMLITKYLNWHKVGNFQCLNPKDLPLQESYDIVVSNYAFSECVRAVQQSYLDNIVKHSHHGYFTLNFLDTASSAGGYTAEELISTLSAYGFNPRVLPEKPETGSDNVILIW